LIQAALMAAALERGVQPERDDLVGETGGNNPSSD
jgi:hypothetical protein